MHKNAAIVYWIERGSGELRSQTMEPHDLRGSGTYESEVRIKYAVDPLEMTTIYCSRFGNDWERSEVERLKALSASLRKDRAE